MSVNKDFFHDRDTNYDFQRAGRPESGWDAADRLPELLAPTHCCFCAVTAEACLIGRCPHGVPAAVADAGDCPVRTGPLRRSARLLLDRGGRIIQVTRSKVHWG